MNRLLIAAVFILSFANIAGAGDLKNPSLPPAVHYGEPLLFGQAHSNTPNNILNVMASPYNAKGDGLANDLPAIQHAIYDACNLPNPPTGNPDAIATRSVYLPSPPVRYMHFAPIRTPCENLEVFSQPNNKGYGGLSQNYFGPAVIMQAWGLTGLAYSTSLVSGPGNSLLSTQTLPQPQVIDVARMVNAPGTNNLASQFASGFNIAFFIKETTDSGGIALASSPSYPGTGLACTGGGFCFTFGVSGRQITEYVLTSGGLVTIGACPAQTLSGVYEAEIDWDGTTYRGWQGVPGGTAVACGTPQTSSNPMIQSPFEVIMLPPHGRTQFWPVAGQGGVDTGFVGGIDSVRFEKGSVHMSAYTVPSVKFTADANTFYLTNFENPLDGANLGYTYNGVKVYSPVTTNNVGYVANANIHDLELCGGVTPNTDGLWVSGANDSIFKNLTCSDAYYSQFDFAENDYFDRIDNLHGFGGQYGIDYGGAFNGSMVMNNGVDETSTACVIHEGGGGGPFEDYHEKCVNRGTLYYGWIEDQSSAEYYYPDMDMEAGATNFVASILLNQPLGYYFNGAGLAAAAGAPFIIQDNGGVGSTFLGAHFGQVDTTPPSYIIDYTNGTPSTPTRLNNTVNPIGVPISNLMAQVIHDNACRGSVTLSSGSGVFSDQCLFSNDRCSGIDTTTAANGPATVFAFPTAGRAFADGVTNTDTSLVSATAAFVAGDVGRQVYGSGIYPGSTITTVTNGTTVVLSHVTTATATGVFITLAASSKITAGTSSDVMAVLCQ